jgi:uncharacterized Zn finger protein (UPF0148 family)
MENVQCPICGNALTEIHGETKCPICGWLQNREEQDLPSVIADELGKSET